MSELDVEMDFPHFAPRTFVRKIHCYIHSSVDNRSTLQLYLGRENDSERSPSHGFRRIREVKENQGKGRNKLVDKGLSSKVQ